MVDGLDAAGIVAAQVYMTRADPVCSALGKSLRLLQETWNQEAPLLMRPEDSPGKCCGGEGGGGGWWGRWWGRW